MGVHCMGSLLRCAQRTAYGRCRYTGRSLCAAYRAGERTAPPERNSGSEGWAARASAPDDCPPPRCTAWPTRGDAA
jgi:hypothetical protein